MIDPVLRTLAPPIKGLVPESLEGFPGEDRVAALPRGTGT